MDNLRRKLLQGSSSAALLSSLLGTGLLVPGRSIAEAWNRNAFGARSIGEALKFHASASAAETREIVINAPEIAENGAKVDVEITSNLEGTRTLAVFADKNPFPLCAVIEFSDPVLPFAKIQLKLSESTRIRAVARTADGKFHVAFREIKVTLGGCGA